MNSRLLMAGAAVLAIVAIGLGIRLLSPDDTGLPRGRSTEQGFLNVGATGNTVLNVTPAQNTAPAQPTPAAPLNLGNLIPTLVPNRGGRANGDPGAPPANGNPLATPAHVNPLAQPGTANPLGGNAPEHQAGNPRGAGQQNGNPLGAH